jgi:hypothetical protein
VKADWQFLQAGIEIIENGKIKMENDNLKLKMSSRLTTYYKPGYQG